MRDIQTLYQSFTSAFPNAISKHTFKRNQIVLSAGERETKVYIVEKGALMVSFTDENHQRIIRFGYSGSILSSLPSFFDDSPSLFDIVAIRKTDILQLDKEVFVKFLQSSEDQMKTYLSVLEDLVRQQIEREIDLLTDSPLKRYHRVLARSPKLFQEVPAVYIAAYLRMSPEHLSRLRNS